MVHRRVNRPLRSELYLGLGGVDVHIHRIELGSQMEDTAGVLTHHFLVFIGFLQGGGHQGRFHLSPIDKKELPTAAVPAAGGLGGEAGDGQALIGGLDFQKAQSDIPAQHSVDGGFQLAVPWGEQFLAAVPNKFYTQLRVGQRGPLYHGEDSSAFGGVFFHKFQPGRSVEEQIPYHQSGASGTARLLHRPWDASFQSQRGPQFRAVCSGKNLNAGHRGDRGQGLPPKA